MSIDITIIGIVINIILGASRIKEDRLFALMNFFVALIMILVVFEVDLGRFVRWDIARDLKCYSNVAQLGK